MPPANCRPFRGLGVPPATILPSNQNPYNMYASVKRIRLDARQQQVVSMLCQGLTRKEIAAKLSVTLRVIDHVMDILFQQLDCVSAPQLVAFCVKYKLVPDLPAATFPVSKRKIKAIFIGPPPPGNGRGFFPFMEYLLNIEQNGHICIAHELFPYQQKEYKTVEEFFHDWDDIRNL